MVLEAIWKGYYLCPFYTSPAKTVRQRQQKRAANTNPSHTRK